jgi:hypothetical protein
MKAECGPQGAMMGKGTPVFNYAPSLEFGLIDCVIDIVALSGNMRTRSGRRDILRGWSSKLGAGGGY